ncbi:hypothetical protein M378DRAFT_164091, partial [Amanita muscaria Koide BX008]
LPMMSFLMPSNIFRCPRRRILTGQKLLHYTFERFSLPRFSVRRWKKTKFPNSNALLTVPKTC